MEDLVLTPSECVALINQTLEIAYPTVLVEGEIASFKISRDKYVFFDLKDDEVTLGCFMMLWQLKTPLEDGMRVKVLAEPRLTKWGKFSLNIRQVMPVGEGSIKRAFEMLKKKLEAEGLLDEARKRPLPRFPKTIGLVGSVESAGYADFMKILEARWSGIEVRVANVQVQGMSAISQNIAAVNYFSQHEEPVDILVVIRGGGSADDLAVYNDEQLARAIAASRIPTIVGVGHEVDTSLADLVADVRAATPSNAAQIVVPDRQEVLSGVLALKQLLGKEVDRHFESLDQDITYMTQQLARSIDVGSWIEKVETHRRNITENQQRLIEAKQRDITAYLRTLRQLDPHAVLRRGYTLVRKEQQLASSAHNFKKDDIIDITFNDGTVEGKVTNVRHQSKKG